MKWILCVQMAAMLSALAQGPPMLSAEEADEKIRYDMKQNLIPAGEAYAILLIDGPDVRQYERLGELYFDEEKPHQSKFYYELALAKEPGRASAQAGLDRAIERIDFLAERFQMYQTQANEGGDATNFGSMAAIKFHLGFQNEAFELLKDAMATYGEDARVAPLAKTFQQDIQYRLTVLNELVGQYRALDHEKQGRQAVELLGQMVFGSYGSPDMLVVLEEFKKSRPDLIHEESYLLLLEFIRNYPNRKS